jgi:hypothetical protein
MGVGKMRGIQSGMKSFATILLFSHQAATTPVFVAIAWFSTRNNRLANPSGSPIL